MPIKRPLSKKFSNSILILCLCLAFNSTFAQNVSNELRNVNVGLQTKATQARESFPIKDLYKKGDVFNIEAGKPALGLAPGKIWVNLGMVLDRPLIEGVTLDTITESNIYPLKEMSILDYNETKVNLGILLITNYYIQNAHNLLNKADDNTIYITLQIHRNTSGPKSVEYFSKLILNCLQEDFTQKLDAQGFPILEIPNKHVVITFRKGSKKNDFQSYGNTDILFSISLVGGLNPSMKSGDFSVAQAFIPFDIDQYDLFLNQRYSVNNHLVQDLDNILGQNQEKYFDKLNTVFKSPNPNKMDMAKKLTRADFKLTTSLQIEGNFYPKDKEKMVKVYGNN